jgi:hypothetical protein
MCGAVRYQYVLAVDEFVDRWLNSDTCAQLLHDRDHLCEWLSDTSTDGDRGTPLQQWALFEEPDHRFARDHSTNSTLDYRAMTILCWAVVLVVCAVRSQTVEGQGADKSCMGGVSDIGTLGAPAHLPPTTKAGHLSNGVCASTGEVKKYFDDLLNCGAHKAHQKRTPTGIGRDWWFCTACNQTEVLCRFHRDHNLFWVPDLHAPLRPIDASGPLSRTYEVAVYNCGECVGPSCDTHLWARLVGLEGPAEALIIGLSSSTFEPSADGQARIMLRFTVPVTGEYSLEIEQRWWQGGAPRHITESRGAKFEFAPTGLMDYPGKTASGKHWKAFLDTGCLRLAGSPYRVEVVASVMAPPPETTSAQTPTTHQLELDAVFLHWGNRLSGHTHGPRRKCTMKDLENPGYVHFLSRGFDLLEHSRADDRCCLQHAVVLWCI